MEEDPWVFMAWNVAWKLSYRTGEKKKKWADSEELTGKIFKLVQFEGHYNNYSILTTFKEN